MTETSSILCFKRVEYAPDWLTSNWYRNQGLIKNLVQIKFSLDDEIFLFPNFENIFSRSQLVREWWFLPPEDKGCPIYQSEEDIDNWWDKAQSIYDSSISSKVSSQRHLGLFLDATSNPLVNSFFLNLATRPDRTDSDEENSQFSICYYYNFFHDLGIEKHWRWWLLSKATISYYHTLFAPKLNGKDNNREILRLSNRFPEYAEAVRYLDTVRESLYRERYSGAEEKEKTDRFFKTQLADTKNEVLATKKLFGKFVPPVYCQCRVCGLIFMSTIKIVGNGNGKGQAIKICSSQNCEKAWDVFRKSLPPIPNDPEAGMILLSHL